MTDNHSNCTTAYLAAFAAVIVWGSAFVATKMVLTSFSAVAYVVFRFTAASLVFAIILLRSRLPRIPLKSHLRLALMALFEPGLYFVFETTGLQRTTASSASIIIASVPVVVAVLAALILKERLPLRGWLGALLSIGGIALLSLWDGSTSLGEGSSLGNLLVFLAVLSASGYIILARHLSASLSTLQITAFQILYGTLYFLPGFVWLGATGRWPEPDLVAVGALLFLIFGATLGAFLSYNFSLSRLGAARSAVFLNGIPVVTVVVAALLLGERISYHHGIAALLVIAGVTIANQPRKRAAQATSPGVG